jgi:uncharacterized protein (DUF924 family)
MKLWFSKNAEIDQQIASEFMDIHSKLVDNQDFLGSEPDQILASIIVLDQFSRNMFRGKPESFAYDEKALALTKVIHPMIQNGQATHFGSYEKMFAYIPLMHSESIQEQQRGLEIYEQLSKEHPEELASVFNYQKQHTAIIQRFNRFPHRNEILNRESTQEEIDFLKEEGSSF